MKESNFKKTKLASVLLLSTVLLPNIAYAEEENDEVENAEHLEVQLFNELSSDSDENQPILNDDSNTDIEMDDSIQEEPASDDAEDEEELLIPAEADEEFEGIIDETEEDESVDSGERPEGEEETPSGATPEITNPEMNVPDTGEGETVELEIPEVPEIPIEPIEPIEPAEPEVPAEPTEPETPVEPEIPVEPTEPEAPVEPETPIEPTEPQIPYEPEESFELEIPDQDVPFEPEISNNDENEEYVEETEPSVEEETTGTGSGPKKLYRYNHGDILNGINFDSRNIENDMSMLDQRVTRVLSSQIIEEKDLTEEQKLELEETENETTPHGAEELPDTGETNKANYTVIGMLSIIGGIMVLLSKKVKTDN